MAEFRYRYRWLTSNLPKEVVFQYLEICAPLLHPVRQAMSKNAVTEWIAYRFLPYYKVPAYGAYKKMTLEQKLAWEKLVTFDALTPRYDNPMTTETFTRIIKEEGFEIQWLHDPPINPLLARAIKTL
jgi:hypothetical protein